MRFVVSLAWVLASIAFLSINIIPQESIMDKLDLVRPMISTRADVEKVFGLPHKGQNSARYFFDDRSIRILFSDGSCTEGWRAPKDVVVKAEVQFFKRLPLSSLKKSVTYTRFRFKRSYDVAGEKYYYDDATGREYGINDRQGVWLSLTYYPSKRFSKNRCDD